MLKNAAALNCVFWLALYGFHFFYVRFSKNVSCPHESESVLKILMFTVRVWASKIICEIAWCFSNVARHMFKVMANSTTSTDVRQTQYKYHTNAVQRPYKCHKRYKCYINTILASYWCHKGWVDCYYFADFFLVIKGLS